MIFSNILGTGVVRRIKYDTHTNSFIGFSTPLSGGIPSPCHFKTDSISELKLWMDKNEKAPLLNIHCVQAIPPPNQTVAPPSFVLVGYGTSSKYTSLDILRRWLFIHKNSVKQHVRILGFSTGKFKSFSETENFIHSYLKSPLNSSFNFRFKTLKKRPVCFQRYIESKVLMSTQHFIFTKNNRIKRYHSL